MNLFSFEVVRETCGSAGRARTDKPFDRASLATTEHRTGRNGGDCIPSHPHRGGGSASSSYTSSSITPRRGRAARGSRLARTRSCSEPRPREENSMRRSGVHSVRPTHSSGNLFFACGSPPVARPRGSRLAWAAYFLIVSIGGLGSRRRLGKIRVNSFRVSHRLLGGLPLASSCCLLLAGRDLSPRRRRQLLFCFAPKLSSLLALCSTTSFWRPDQRHN
jgi:hypothetical protein